MTRPILAAPGLSVRTPTALSFGGVKTMAEARAMTDAQLLALDNFTPACLAEVRGYHETSRSWRVRDAVLRRVGEMGDMPIRVRRATLKALIEACGFGGMVADFDQGDGRARFIWIEAVALECIARTGRRLAA